MEIELLSDYRQAGRSLSTDHEETMFSAALEKERMNRALVHKTSGHVNPTPELTTYGVKLGWVQQQQKRIGLKISERPKVSSTISHHISVFAMYFLAVTGVQAGANICGDLRDPATAIPKGTFLAIFISLTSYMIMAILAGMGALRDASGDPSNLTPKDLESCKPQCEYGLHNNYEIMQLMSLWPPLIYGGCWAATLSTALTNLLSVPRLIQALGTDRIYPGLVFFSKPYGRYGEPYRGYVLTYCVSLLILLTRPPKPLQSELVAPPSSPVGVRPGELVAHSKLMAVMNARSDESLITSPSPNVLGYSFS